MVNRLEQLFPGLQPAGYRITSVSDRQCNCIAWAAGDTSIWWWPLDELGVFWPPDVPLEHTIDAFHRAFAGLGYVVCEGEQLESGYEKIALFADATGLPTHAARQLPNGRWTSKLGESEDIEHTLHDLEGDLYGVIVQIMRRPLQTNPVV